MRPDAESSVRGAVISLCETSPGNAGPRRLRRASASPAWRLDAAFQAAWSPEVPAPACIPLYTGHKGDVFFQKMYSDASSIALIAYPNILMTKAA